jgi:regulator of protease activity HflC (stomatin/prohibitin superfamily)
MNAGNILISVQEYHAGYSALNVLKTAILFDKKDHVILFHPFQFKIMATLPITYVIIGMLILLLLSGIRIAQEYQRSIVFRLGRFNGLRGPGIYYLIPLIERQQKVDMRTNTVTLEQQETITKDSVTIKVNAVLWFRITNPEDAIIKVADYYKAVYQFSVTALRNIIGQHSLDEVLRERQQINGTLQQMVDEATEPWGIKIEMVEMKDVEIPEGMQRAMAREAEAIREKRARIVKAEAELEASIKLTQGATVMEGSPIALELRRMQMLSEIGIDNNTTTIVLVPSDFTNAAQSFASMVNRKKLTE